MVSIGEGLGSIGAREYAPGDKAAKTRSASLSLGTVSDNEKPWKFALSVWHPSDAMIVVCPTRKLACMTLFSDPGGILPGSGGSGLSLKRISISTSAPRAFL